MPRRPLSAYNIFFKEQRAQLLAERQAQGKAGGEKIGFEKMAKTIGKRWKELAPEELERCKKLAKEDTERYRREMDAYHHELALKGRREREESSRRRLEAEVERQGRQQALSARVGGSLGEFAGTHLAERDFAASAFAAAGTYGSLLGGAGQQALLQNALRLGSLGQPSSLLGNSSSDELLLRQALLNQARNQEILASLSPGLQQQLLLQTMQGGGDSGFMSSGLGTLSSAAASLSGLRDPPGSGSSRQDGPTDGWY